MTTLTDELIASTLHHLEWLVAAPTANPPRRIGESGIVDRLAAELGSSFVVDVTDLGEGSINVLARRGTPNILFNFHLDTVPAADHWDGSPYTLRVADGRATGLGACDIKGATAAMIAAVKVTDGDVALLFSSDEEAGNGRCIHAFLEQRHRFDGVVVAEPTRGQAVLAHRGVVTASGIFRGQAGHASRSNALDDSATHDAVRWGASAVASARASFDPASKWASHTALPGLRFNLGRIEGGEKPNVVAAEARVRFGVRMPPGCDPSHVLGEFQSLAPHPDRVEWEVGFVGPPLPADGGDGLTNAGLALAARLGLPIGSPVDFWTEAALFSAAGYPAIVLGSGDIAQAHTRNEWVALEELAQISRIYQRLLTNRSPIPSQVF